MKAFQLKRIPEILAGPGKIKILPELIKKYGDRAAIIVGASSFVSSQYYLEVEMDLEKAGIEVEIISSREEPKASFIDGCVEALKGKGITVVAAIGGGSVMDTGKAISAMMHLDHSVENYLDGMGTRKHDGKKLPFIAVPTTAGTGSEMTANAPLGKLGHDGYKKSLRHDNFIPDHVIIDPLLYMSCPQGTAYSSGMDAFTQLVESYLSTKSSTVTDQLSIKGMKLLLASLHRLFDHEDDHKEGLWSDMATASMLSGITLLNAGLGTVHGMASTISKYYDIAHGTICANLMLQTNVETLKTIEEDSEIHGEAMIKYGKLASLFKDFDFYRKDADFTDMLSCYMEKLDIPTMASMGFDDRYIDTIAGESGDKNNPVKLTIQAKKRILEKLL